MPVVHREHGLRFVIFVDDHPPAHVHVTDRGTARIALEPSVALMESRGLSRADVGRVLDVVRSKRDTMLQIWIETHG